MFRSLLSFPEADAVQDESVPLASKDWSRLPLIEKLCDYLVDPPAQEVRVYGTLFLINTHGSCVGTYRSTSNHNLYHASFQRPSRCTHHSS